MLKRLLLCLGLALLAAISAKAQSLGQVMRMTQARYQAWAVVNNALVDDYNEWELTNGLPGHKDHSPTSLDWENGLAAYPADAEAAALDQSGVHAVFDIIGENTDFLVISGFSNTDYRFFNYLNIGMGFNAGLAAGGSYVYSDVSGGADFLSASGSKDIPTVIRHYVHILSQIESYNGIGLIQEYGSSVDLSYDSPNGRSFPDITKTGLTATPSLAEHGIAIHLQDGGIILGFPGPVEGVPPPGASSPAFYDFLIRAQGLKIGIEDPLVLAAAPHSLTATDGIWVLKMEVSSWKLSANSGFYATGGTIKIYSKSQESSDPSGFSGDPVHSYTFAFASADNLLLPETGQFTLSVTDADRNRTVVMRYPTVSDPAGSITDTAGGSGATGAVVTQYAGADGSTSSDTWPDYVTMVGGDMAEHMSVTRDGVTICPYLFSFWGAAAWKTEDTVDAVLWSSAESFGHFTGAAGRESAADSLTTTVGALVDRTAPTSDPTHYAITPHGGTASLGSLAFTLRGDGWDATYAGGVSAAASHRTAYPTATTKVTTDLDVNGRATIVKEDFTALTRTVWTGVPDNATAPTSVTDGAKTVLSYSAYGVPQSSVTTDIVSGAQTAGWTGSDFDNLQRPATVTDFNGDAASHYTYDVSGNVLTATGPDGSTSTCTYDGINRLTSATTPSASTTWTYAGLTTTETCVSAGKTVTTVTVRNFSGELVSQDVTGDTTPVSITVAPEDAGFHRTTTTSFRVTHEILRSDRRTPTRVYQTDAAGHFLSGVDYAYGSGSAPGSGPPCVAVTMTPEDDAHAPIAAKAVTTYYDVLGRIQGAQSADGATAYAYDGSGNVSSVTPPAGLPVSYAYDSLGRITQVTYGTKVTHYAYAITGGALTTTTSVAADGGPLVTDITSVNFASGAVTSKPFGDDNLAVTRTVDPVARTVSVSAPGAGYSATTTLKPDLLSTTTGGSSAAGAFTASRTVSGLFGQVQGASAAAGYSTSSTFTPATGSAGAQMALTLPTGTTSTTVTPDSVSVTAPGGNSSVSVNNATRVASVTTPATNYTIGGSLGQTGVSATLTTNATSGPAPTVFSDNFDHTSSKTFADSSAPHSAYNRTTRTLTDTLASTATTTSTYDDYGALLTFNEGVGTGVSITRNLLGSPVSLSDNVGARTFTYDDRGNLKGVTYTAGAFTGTSLTYDVETTSLRRPLGFTLNVPGDSSAFTKAVTYVPASDARVATVTGLGVTAQYALNPDGRPASVTVVDGANATLTRRTFTYDSGRLTTVGTYAGSATLPVFNRMLGFGTGADSQRRTVASTEDGSHWVYAYAAGGALTRATLKDALSVTVPGYDFAYAPDGLSNRAGGTQRGGTDLVATETPDLLNAPVVVAEPGLLQVTGTLAPTATLAAYAWDAAAPVTLIGPWTSLTAAANSGAAAEYSAALTPGAWRPSLNWPAVGSPATAVRVTLTLPGHAEEIVTVNPGQQPGTALAVAGYRATTGGVARVRLAANVPGTGTVGLPTLVWERKVTTSFPAISPVTVAPTAPVAAVVAPSSAITVSGGAYRVLLPAPAGATGAYTQRVMLRATVTDPVSGATGFAECAGGYAGVAGTVSLLHDADGRRSSDVRRTNLVWTPSGRLTGLTMPDGSAVTDTHDAEGRRVTRVRYVGGAKASQTDTFWDGWSPVEEREYDGTGGLLHLRRYLWGQDLDGSSGGMGHVGGLVALTDNGTLYLPAYDASGHVIGLLDSAGAVVANYEYGPFGEPLRETGPAAGACPYRWNTRRWDADTQLYYFGYRHYDPVSGSWLSREPLGEGSALNLYAYCGGDPVNNFDYLGLEPISSDVPSPIQLWLKREQNEIRIRQLAIDWNAKVDAVKYAGIGLPYYSQGRAIEKAGAIVMRAAVDVSDEQKVLIGENAFLTKLIDIHKLIGPDGYGRSNMAPDRQLALRHVFGDVEMLAIGNDFFAPASGRDPHLDAYHTLAKWGVRSLSADVAFMSFGAGGAIEGGTQAGIRLGTISRYQIGGFIPESAIATDGSFSIIDWSGYPEGLAKPDGPFRLLEGAEYDVARKAANTANKSLRRELGLVGEPVDIHEIQPVKFDGSPIDPTNKVILPRDFHRQEVTPWWNQRMSDIQRN